LPGGLGSEPGIFWFCLFSHSIALPLSHSGSPIHNILILCTTRIYSTGPNWGFNWTLGVQRPMLWFLKYFRQKVQQTIGFFLLEIKLNYAKIRSQHWFLRFFRQKIVENRKNCDHNIDPRIPGALGGLWFFIRQWSVGRTANWKLIK
jgi:hypothetical protein